MTDEVFSLSHRDDAKVNTIFEQLVLNNKKKSDWVKKQKREAIKEELDIENSEELPADVVESLKIDTEIELKELKSQIRNYKNQIEKLERKIEEKEETLNLLEEVKEGETLKTEEEVELEQLRENELGRLIEMYEKKGSLTLNEEEARFHSDKSREMRILEFMVDKAELFSSYEEVVEELVGRGVDKDDIYTEFGDV